MKVKKNNYTSKHILFDFYKMEKYSFLWLILYMISSTSTPLLMAYMPKILIDSISNNVGIKYMIIKLLVFTVLIALTSWISPCLEQQLSGASQRMVIEYSTKLFNKVMRIKIIDLESYSGRLQLEKASQFVEENENGVYDYLNIISEFLKGLLGLIATTVLLHKIPSVFLVIILLSAFIEFLLHYIECKYDKIVLDNNSNNLMSLNYFYRISNNISAGKDIRNFSLYNLFAKLVNAAYKAYENISKKHMNISFILTLARTLLIFARDFIIYFQLGKMVYCKFIGISDFVFLTGIVFGLSKNISLIAYSCNRYSLFCYKYKNFFSFLNLVDDKEAYNVAIKNEIKENLILKLEHIYFKYNKNDNDTLKDISLEIKNGEKIAIVGENGSGKSTLIKIICGLYAPTQGNILLNNINSDFLNKEQYYSIYSTVFQDSIIYPTTILKNITLSDNCDEKKLQDIIAKTEINQFICKLKNGIETKVGKELFKDGVDLSGGEKQKIFIARALYKDYEMLIFDEPTSAMDAISELSIYEKYSQIAQNKPSIFITHRLNSTRFCDRILLMQNGKIIEQGTHEELMNCKGQYYDMFNTQSYYYKEENI